MGNDQRHYNDRHDINSSPLYVLSLQVVGIIKLYSVAALLGIYMSCIDCLLLVALLQKKTKQ